MDSPIQDQTIEASLQSLEQSLLPIKNMEPSIEKAKVIHEILSQVAENCPSGNNMMTRQLIARQIFPYVGIMEEGETTTSVHLARIGADAISGIFSPDEHLYETSNASF